ncbi:MAG: ATP-binding protein [Muribaculum sp.]|nr:ATP-binding protein [Muribaculum sp.]
MIDKIRIQNLRSLKDTGFVPIKPITVLLGSNSSGKSTFLRSFPLLTQTVSKHLRTAIAWFDENLVDFGDFSTSLSRFADNDNTITFSFELTEPEESQLSRSYLLRIIRYAKDEVVNLLKISEITVSYAKHSDGKTDIVSEVKIVLKSRSEVKFIFKEKSNEVSIITNGEPWTVADFTWRNPYQGMFLPVLDKKLDPAAGFHGYYSLYDELIKRAMEPWREECGKKVKHFEKLDTLVAFWDPDPNVFLSNLKKCKTYASLKSKIEKWNIKSKKFKEVYNRILGLFCFVAWPELNSQLGRFFINCDYIAPLRAEATRYYRNQGQQISRIDAYGRNLSEFIDSLTPTQKESYNSFVKSILGVNVNVRNAAGHQSITLTRRGRTDRQEGEEKPQESNIADVGFGYSQILPIITKLWFMQERSRFSTLAFYKERIVTALIEQPELHLHPGLQAKLTDAFIQAATNNDAKTNVIVETHSPTIINRIGRRIREGHLSVENVNIVLFERDHDGQTTVKCSKFNQKGQLLNWPYGFFEPDDDEYKKGINAD